MNRLIPRQPTLCDETLVAQIAQAESISALTARALIRRGVSSADEAKSFLHPSENSLHDPYLLPDMEPAVERVRFAIKRNERVCIFGDYDADGVCATAMLYKRLLQMGADAVCHIPMRHNEGYGLTEETVHKLNEMGSRLVITVDNGISAYHEIALCSALHMDVIVTDHHSAGKVVPECAAVVSASRRDSVYPNPHLCGAGVAFKLIQALTDDGYSDEELALAAVATIADVVPLIGENRAIASCGLKFVSQVKGFGALLNVAAWKQPRLDEQTVSFVIAPRLNAAGRISNAMHGVELLTSDDQERVAELACKMDGDNQKRKDAESEILLEAQRQIDRMGAIRRAILLKHASWNAGVIGIVASRLCETYHVPVILFSEQDGVLTGSGRSIEGVDLYACLTLFSERFVRYGGHARAAGVTMLADRYETFCADFIDYVASAFADETFRPAYAYDEDARFASLTPAQVQELNRLAPYGEGNPEPVFRFDDITFASRRTMGKDERHFCASAMQGEQVLRVVAFGKGELKDALEQASVWELAARPTINVYRGESSVELHWVCANPKPVKSHFFDAFLQEYLYNSSCSDTMLAEWVFSDIPSDARDLDDAFMRTAYRSLQSVTKPNGASVDSILRMCTNREMLALCVFLQLGFFLYDAEAHMIFYQSAREPRRLEESSLYRVQTSD